MAPDLKFFYLLSAARDISALISLRYEYAQQSDRWAYAVHHFVSTVLVLGLAMAGYIRIGCVVMLFMDWVDPFLWTANMFHLSVERNDQYQFLANRFFELFRSVFALTRIVMLSFVVWIILREFPSSAYVLKVLSTVLVLLQSVWFVNIVGTVLNRGNVDDIQSDVKSEGDQRHEKVYRKRRNFKNRSN